MVKPSWRRVLEAAGDWTRGDGRRPADGLLWRKDLGHHLHGEFSMAVIQANDVLEDQSRVESGPLTWVEPGPRGTFIGVYDGHGGAQASRFTNQTLFSNLKRLAAETGEISASVIKAAFLETDKEFLSMVRQQWTATPQIASSGTCCLVGLICDGHLYVANAGDSRAVLGSLTTGRDQPTVTVTAMQISTDHNANLESVRDELHALHPHDPQIVALKHKVWRVKGLIQVSRSIGDVYLKDPEFNREPLLAKFRLPQPFSKPILSSEPSILVHKLNPGDRFVIFASDGLWEHLSNQEAVDIVNSYPRRGIACRLVKAALRVAAKKREMRYTDLKKIDRGVRRHFHDDITVVVVFIDQPCVRSSSVVSITGGEGVV